MRKISINCIHKIFKDDNTYQYLLETACGIKVNRYTLPVVVEWWDFTEKSHRCKRCDRIKGVVI